MKKMNKKSILMLATMVLLLTFAVGGTIAYIATSAGPVTNTFEPGKVDTQIDEPGWDHKTKSNVTITNTGNTKAYIRAAIVVTWETASGEVLGQAPVLGTDYTLALNQTNWSSKQNDGFYYHKGAVDAYDENSTTDTTAVLITECKVLKAAPEAGYTLHVEIIASAVQAEPDTAVTELWGSTAAGLVK